MFFFVSQGVVFWLKPEIEYGMHAKIIEFHFILNNSLLKESHVRITFTYNVFVFIFFLVRIFVHFMKPSVLTRMITLDANCFCPRSFSVLLSHVFHVLCAFFAGLHPFFAALLLYSSALQPIEREKKTKKKWNYK